MKSVLIWIALGGFGLVRAAAPQERMKVILDTDIGTDIDDAWALAFVIQHAGSEPLGITISDADTPARARVY